MSLWQVSQRIALHQSFKQVCAVGENATTAMSPTLLLHK